MGLFRVFVCCHGSWRRGSRAGLAEEFLAEFGWSQCGSARVSSLRSTVWTIIGSYQNG